MLPSCSLRVKQRTRQHNWQPVQPIGSKKNYGSDLLYNSLLCKDYIWMQLCIVSLLVYPLHRQTYYMSMHVSQLELQLHTFSNLFRIWNVEICINSWTICVYLQQIGGHILSCRDINFFIYIYGILPFSEIHEESIWSELGEKGGWVSKTGGMETWREA